MPETSPPPSLIGLFTGFLGVGMFGFGGVLPWARRMVVDQRRWMTATEFTDLLSLCQFLPGPNIINVSVALGARYHGPIGSVSAFAGLMAAPMTIVLSLAMIYGRFGTLPPVRQAFAGLAAAAAALLLSTALRIAAPLRGSPAGLVIGLATVAAIAVFRWPLPLVLAVMAPVSIAAAHWARAGIAHRARAGIAPRARVEAAQRARSVADKPACGGGDDGVCR